MGNQLRLKVVEDISSIAEADISNLIFGILGPVIIQELFNDLSDKISAFLIIDLTDFPNPIDQTLFRFDRIVVNYGAANNDRSFPRIQKIL